MSPEQTPPDTPGRSGAGSTTPRAKSTGLIAWRARLRPDLVRWIGYKPDYAVTPVSLVALLLIIGVASAALAVSARPVSVTAAACWGCVIAVTLGHVVPYVAIWFTRWRARLDYLFDNHPTSDVLSIVERLVVYWGCATGLGPEVVAAWITLKTLSKWTQWRDKAVGDLGKGRATYYVFLIGTAVSVGCAVAAAAFAVWLIDPKRAEKILSFRFGPS